MSGMILLGPVPTPDGVYRAVFTAAGLGCLAFPYDETSACEAWVRRWAPGVQVCDSGAPLAELAEQLSAYFTGRLREFSVPLDLRGTPFQLQVWRALLAIGYGQVRSYAALAAAIGRPQAYRAVGAANGANPIPILVPCHRLVGSNGSLIKYGGGLDRKRWLLGHEGVAVAE